MVVVHHELTGGKNLVALDLVKENWMTIDQSSDLSEHWIADHAIEG